MFNAKIFGERGSESNWGEQYLMVENLKVVWAKFSI
jgi:hypothetical protein